MSVMHPLLLCCQEDLQAGRLRVRLKNQPLKGHAYYRRDRARSPPSCRNFWRRRKYQNRQVTEFIGGPAWTRTRNQTVMSAVPYRKNRANSVIPDRDRASSCTFVHGVSAG